MSNYWIDRYENERFTGARYYLVISAASVFSILFYHFCHGASKSYKAIANGWLSLLFQVLMVGIFLTGFSFARMTNFDLLHGLAFGYYIAGILFPHSKMSIFYHCVIIALLILNTYFLVSGLAVGNLNFPIMMLCIHKCGDLMSDITYLLIQYEAAPDIINLASIFQILMFIYTRFILTRLIFPSTFSRLYNLFGLIIMVMSCVWCIGQMISLYKRITTF